MIQRRPSQVQGASFGLVRALFGLVGSLLLLAIPARGASSQAIVQTFSFAPAPWNETVELPLFDSSLGALQSVVFELAAEVRGMMAYESLDATPQQITMRLQAEVNVGAPGGLVGVSEMIAVTPKLEIVESATAFDGGIDFGGDSGSQFIDQSVSANESTTYDSSNPLWEFSIRDYFTTAAPGTTVELPVSAVSQSSGSGADTLATILQTGTDGDLTVTYFYAPIPEPASLALVASGLLLIARRRR